MSNSFEKPETVSVIYSLMSVKQNNVSRSILFTQAVIFFGKTLVLPNFSSTKSFSLVKLFR